MPTNSSQLNYINEGTGKSAEVSGFPTTKTEMTTGTSELRSCDALSPWRLRRKRCPGRLWDL